MKAKHPVLTEASNVFVLTDEAHRTQYGSLAANLRTALPNAVFFGFTGTPIDKDDRSTLKTFGPYIDQYTIEQAVADEATVPIFYESRLPTLQIIGQTLDQVFDRVFADRTDEERRAIKQKYATEQAVAEAPRRIEAICLDLIDHYTQYIAPNGFKAQVVADEPARGGPLQGGARPPARPAVGRRDERQQQGRGRARRAPSSRPTSART